MTSFVQVLGLLILLAGGDPPTPIPPLPPVWPPTDPVTHTAVLANGDFEAGLVGWQTWREDTGKPAAASTLDYASVPFFSVERILLLVHSGAASLHVGRRYDPWHAGLKRVVSAPPGAYMRFCMDGRLYARNCDFGREASGVSLDGHMQVGLYPDGEADWNTSGSVWSVAANLHNEWQSMCVETVAGPSNRLTLLTSTNYRGMAAKHLDAWWDDAELTIAGSDPSAASNVLLPGIIITQSINVLLLVPAQSTSLSASAFIVWPAQVYVNAQGLTLSMSSTRSNLLSSAVILPTVITPAKNQTAGQSATVLRPLNPPAHRYQPQLLRGPPSRCLRSPQQSCRNLLRRSPLPCRPVQSLRAQRSHPWCSSLPQASIPRRYPVLRDWSCCCWAASVRR